VVQTPLHTPRALDLISRARGEVEYRWLPELKPVDYDEGNNYFKQKCVEGYMQLQVVIICWNNLLAWGRISDGKQGSM